MNATNGAYGTTLITSTRRVRPEYVQYARVAKKVDVRRLKEEIWKGMGLEKLEVKSSSRPVAMFHSELTCDRHQAALAYRRLQNQTPDRHPRSRRSSLHPS
jgi:condensin complex subunit 2